MLNKNLIRKALASCLLITVWSVTSMIALAVEGQDTSASISVTGSVTVNDRSAVSNSTIASGSTITTGDSGDSIATIDLGKTGRVQLLSQSSLVLKFDQNGIYGTLLVGKVRVMNMSGVTTTIATKEGMVIGDTAQANTFVVETECGRTALNTTIGNATLRAEGQDKQVAAGSEAVAGNLQQSGCRPCLRPDPNAVFPTAKFLPVLLPILIGTGIGTAVLTNTGGGGTSIDTGGGGIIISATR